MPRRLRHRLRRHRAGGMVFAHRNERRLRTGPEAIPQAEPPELLTGRLFSLVDRLRLRRHG